MSKRRKIVLFGSGCINDWPWYFEGESTVKIYKLNDIFEWLVDCEYLGDKELFMEDDFWQHPKTFERIRKGDCEDHAIWAWRKLTEIGIPAELICGKTRAPNTKSRHAWVIYHKDDKSYLLEATSKDLNKISQPLATAKYWYQPHVAVDATFKTYFYDGALAYSIDRFEKTDNSETAP